MSKRRLKAAAIAFLLSDMSRHAPKKTFNSYPQTAKKTFFYRKVPLPSLPEILTCIC
jgi:hypothetical protein